MRKVKQPRIRKDDKVIVVTGKDKGKIGTVIKVDTEKSRILIEKVNMVKRHAKPSAKTAQGGIIEKESPVPVSNVMVVCSRCTEATRVGVRALEDETKVRVCKKCDEPMDK